MPPLRKRPRIVEEDDDEDKSPTISVLEKSPKRGLKSPVQKHDNLDDLNDNDIEISDAFHSEYFDIVDQLPLEIRRNYALIYELESSQLRYTRILQDNINEYITLCRNKLNSNDKQHASDHETDPKLPQATIITNTNKDCEVLLSRISSHLLESVRFAEDKVGLAASMYGSIDQTIRRLDNDLQMYEDQLVLGIRPGTQAGHDVPSLNNFASDSQNQNYDVTIGDRENSTESRNNIFRKKAEDSVPEERKTRSSRNLVSNEKGLPPVKRTGKPKPKNAVGDSRLAEIPSELDLSVEIDPNEPRYCYCNGVSSGKMIGCDNDDCEREWFHLECSGLKEVPKGKWYCRDCVEIFEKKSEKSSSRRRR